MKSVNKFILSFLCLLAFVMIAVYAYLLYLKPTYRGDIHLEGVDNAEVYFDNIGVPHIYANTEKDALTVLGYVHAQERLWQMELLRRIASGRLSEIFGKDLYDVDVFFSSLGIDETIHKQVEALKNNQEVQELVDAYLKGVNSYLDDGPTPIEFSLLGIEKEPYTSEDIYYVTAYMSFSFASAFKTDPILTLIKHKLGSDYLKDLAIDSKENIVFQENFDFRKKSIASINSLLDKLPFPQFIGSNGLVLAPKKTTTGKILFENDPHIGFAQPQVWYQAHIKTPTYENYGFYLGLFPFPLLAHNREYAFGLTMFQNDDINFYKIQQNSQDSTQYTTGMGFYNYEYLQKEIKIKKESPRKIIIKKTVLGTIVNSNATGFDSVPTAIQWVYNEKPNQVLQTTYGMNHAKGMYDFEKAIATLSAPGLNILYGDASDNIGMWSAGKLYKHLSPEVNTKFILEGMEVSQIQKEWLPFVKNPKAINPTKGYVFSSNVQPEAVDNYLYPGYYLSQDRAIELKKAIELKDKLSVDEVKNIANSHTNTSALKNVRELTYGLDLESLTPFELKVLDRLVKWKGNHGLDNIAPTIYYKFVFRVLKNTFEDELGVKDFKDFANSNLSKRTQNKYLKNKESVWWDNVNTQTRETFKDVITSSFKAAVSELSTGMGRDLEAWKWGKVHTLTHEHAMAKIEILKKIFNLGPYPSVGGYETINNLMFNYTEGNEFKVVAGPSTRRVIDFSAIENSYAITPTGQSGYFLSPFYSDQTQFFNTGKYHKMLMNEQEIKKSENILRFQSN